MLKLKLCAWHDSPGGCKSGDSCGYAHGEHELRQPRRPYLAVRVVNAVGEDVYKTYKTDEAVSKSAPYEGKNQALNTATSIYTRLDQPEEEDDGN